jgi:hypothetical protein
MVWALVRRKLVRAVNRKRAPSPRLAPAALDQAVLAHYPKDAGFFRVERPDQLWHTDLTAVWVAEHG